MRTYCTHKRHSCSVAATAAASPPVRASVVAMAAGAAHRATNGPMPT